MPIGHYFVTCPAVFGITNLGQSLPFLATLVLLAHTIHLGLSKEQQHEGRETYPPTTNPGSFSRSAEKPDLPLLDFMFAVESLDLVPNLALSAAEPNIGPAAHRRGRWPRFKSLTRKAKAQSYRAFAPCQYIVLFKPAPREENKQKVGLRFLTS